MKRYGRHGATAFLAAADDTQETGKKADEK